MHRCSGRHRQFQSTPPRGWRHHRRAHGNDSGHFNPLHREGGDLVGGASILPVRDFNPLHREGGDWMCQTRWTRNLYFNPLHREGGDNSDGGVFQQYPKFQSTPPRGWRLIRAQSIMYVRDQFQSTPPRGWRRILGHAKSTTTLFQSTPPRGWRLRTISRPGKTSGISIHSTARVETEATTAIGNQAGSTFQSTPPRGWRRNLHHCPRSPRIFQSTPPRGWRQQYYTITTTILHHISTNKSYPTPLKSRPTIPAHSQIRSHCANFPVRIPP